MDISRLSQLRFTYPEIGATAGELPAGYQHLRRSRRIGHGRERFDEASANLMKFGIQRGIGLTVRTSAPDAAVGVDIATRLWPFWALCRVVYVVDEADRRGFAYGTLQGHPETGEELFAVRHDPVTDDVIVDVVAFSRPSFWWVKLGNPAARLAQHIVTQRYLDAL